MKYFFALMFGLLFSATVAKADGGIFYPHNYYATETGQQAFIYFANKTENLVVMTSYEGNAKDFVWVIPTPSKPEVTKGSAELFRSLDILTDTTDGQPDIKATGSAVTLGLADSTKEAVSVIAEKTVDIYDTTVLQATDATALSKWLNDHGYSYPEDKSPMLKSYVDQGWYFVAAKIQQSITKIGTLTPLRLTFASDTIIYPMRLTALALTQGSTATHRIPVTLYVLSDRRTHQDRLTTEWAQWLHTADIQQLNDDLGTDLIPKQKLFLTKMSHTVFITDGMDDFLITAAPNNTEFPVPIYKTAGFWLNNLLYLVVTPLVVFFFPIPLGLGFAFFVLVQLYIKRRWLYVVGSIYQVAACLALAWLSWLYLFDRFNMDGTTDSVWLQEGIIGGFIAAIVLLILGCVITVKMIRHYRANPIV